MTVSEMIESVDILEYISQFADFEQKGMEWWCLSPLTDEETPSFSVRQETQQWYDFSSGKGGNLLSFIKCYNKCGDRQAVEILKKYIGADADKPSPRKMAALQVAKRFSLRRKAKKESKAVVLPDDYMARYQNNREKLSLWAEEGISYESMAKFQVMYDDFQERIVFPIRNVSGQIVNVSGRAVDPDWKSKKLRKYTYFYPLGVLNTVYGLYENRHAVEEKGEIILFEGAKSVMKADTWGIHNTGAILTSHLSAPLMKILARLGVTAVFALDKGVDITQDENIKRLRHYVRVEYLLDTENLLQDKDSPADRGLETFSRLYDRRLIFR